MSHLLSVSALAELLASGAPVRLLDVRWRLDRPDGRPEYLAGHLPGAVFVNLDTELAAHGRPEDGRHPLPSTEQLQAAARRWGVGEGETVVTYDDTKGMAAARAWWLLRQAGVDVRVLDGGIRAWTAAGNELETGDVEPEPSEIELQPIGADALSIDEVAEFPASGVLLDVRSPERYRGETEPMDPAAGHIPGALNLQAMDHVDAEGRLVDAETLRHRFAAVGVTEGTPVAAYCGSGIAAAHTALALHEIGIESKVFPGSWSQWSNTPGRPVATGELPG